jgi:phospholipid transport system substrate-binding protein
MASMLSQAGLRCATMAWCCLVGIIPSHLYAETPIQALQATLDRFQSILQDGGLREDSRQEQVVGVILDRFDFREMSKRILGPHWNQDVNHQDAFVAEFAAFMERTFLNHFDQIKALKVSCRNEEIQGSLAKVMTNLSTTGGEIPINFRMQQHDSGWKIYDVMLDNGSFSLVNNYRTQLRWILQSSSFEQLLQIISEKR